MLRNAVKRLSQAQRGNQASRPPYRLEVGELGVTIGVAQMPAVVGPQAGDGVVRDRWSGGLQRVDDAPDLGIGEADSSIVCAATRAVSTSARSATAGRGGAVSQPRRKCLMSASSRGWCSPNPSSSVQSFMSLSAHDSDQRQRTNDTGKDDTCHVQQASQTSQPSQDISG